MPTTAIDMKSVPALRKAAASLPDKGTNWHRHDGDAFPGLYLAVGKTRATWYLKHRVGKSIKSTRLGTFPEMSAAQALKQGATKSKQARINPEISTVRDGWELHCETSQADGSMSDAHRADMTGKLLRHAPNLLSMHVADVTSAHVQRVINELTTDGKKATARHVRAALRSAFNFADVRNPVANKRVRAPKSAERATFWATVCEEHNLDEDDWQPMWMAINDIKNALRRTAWLVMILTGIRSENVRSLKWDQVDLQQKTIHLPKMKNRLGRTLPVCDTVIQALIAIRSTGSDFVFPASSKTGHIDHLDTLTMIIGDKRIPILRQHDTRAHFMQAGGEAFLPDYVIHHLRGDVMGGAGNDMLMKYMKRMGNRKAVDDIEAVALNKFKVEPAKNLE